LINCSECNEIGLGTSKLKTGKRIGQKTANEILSLYKDIPQITKSGFLHFEEIQLFVDNIAEDRISDITANFVKSFLIDYTIDQCEKVNIPIEKVNIDYFDSKTAKFITDDVFLPLNPKTKTPILFVPKRWIRHTTFINYENYCKEYYSPTILKEGQKSERVKVLNFNRQNYDLVQTYIKIRERQQTDCKNDPLFKQIPVLSAKRKLETILKLPTGKTDNADREYENTLCPLLASLLYPHLDFAQEQSRTESGVSIRDLIFYNNCSEEFLKEIYTNYECKQMVIRIEKCKRVEQ